MALESVKQPPALFSIEQSDRAHDLLLRCKSILVLMAPAGVSGDPPNSEIMWAARETVLEMLAELRSIMRLGEAR